MNYILVFDEEFKKQFKKVRIDTSLMNKLLDRIEILGPEAGKIIDSKLHLYELKMKRPPVRIYYKHSIETNEIYLLAIEMKKSDEMQQKLIEFLRKKFFSMIFFNLDVFLKLEKAFIEPSIPQSLQFSFDLLIFNLWDGYSFHK